LSLKADHPPSGFFGFVLSWSAAPVGLAQALCQYYIGTWYVRFFNRPSAGRLKHVLFHFDQKLTRWAMRKYKSLKTKWQAVKRVMAFKRKNPALLPHW
jgi:RNA-directed DNA polymerase